MYWNNTVLSVSVVHGTININMRCIEMSFIDDVKTVTNKININMRCIEIFLLFPFDYSLRD